MEIRQLKTFMTIVKLGNFSQAAQFLGYTQSSVTTHIQLLEKELGAALFERFGHQLMLTSDGERLYDYAERIIFLTEDVKNQLDSVEVPHGTLIIGMPESVCVYHLRELLKEYTELYPKVTLKVQFGICSDFKALLRKNMMDIAFSLENGGKDADLVHTLLWPEPIVMVASPKHSLAGKDMVTAKDLAGQTVILTEPGSSYRGLLEANLKKASVHPARILEIGHIPTIKDFVVSNVGLTILPLVAVKDELAAGRLTVLRFGGAELETNAYLIYHKEKWLSHAIRNFIKLVQERLLK